MSMNLEARVKRLEKTLRQGVDDERVIAVYPSAEYTRSWVEVLDTDLFRFHVKLPTPNAFWGEHVTDDMRRLMRPHDHIRIVVGRPWRLLVDAETGEDTGLYEVQDFDGTWHRRRFDDEGPRE